MAIPNITDEQKVTLTVVGMTAGGRQKPIPAGEVVAWSNDQPGLASLSTPDQASTDLVGAAPGSGNVSVSALGLTASEPYTVEAAPIVGLAIQAGAPTPQ